MYADILHVIFYIPIYFYLKLFTIKIYYKDTYILVYLIYGYQKATVSFSNIKC